MPDIIKSDKAKLPKKKYKYTKKTGRPCGYTIKIAEAICNGIKHDLPLMKILEAVKVDQNTFYRWIDKFPEFWAMYARAREIQAQIWEDRILQIAGDTSEDELFTSEGRRYQNSEFINRSRLKVDSLKWLMSKRIPKKYGERQTVEHEGEIKHIVRVALPAKLPKGSE